MLLSWTGILNYLNCWTVLSSRKGLQDIVLSPISGMTLHFLYFHFTVGTWTFTQSHTGTADWKERSCCSPSPCFGSQDLGDSDLWECPQTCSCTRSCNVAWGGMSRMSCHEICQEQCVHPTFKLLQSIGKRTSKLFFSSGIFTTVTGRILCLAGF